MGEGHKAEIGLGSTEIHSFSKERPSGLNKRKKGLSTAEQGFRKVSVNLRDGREAGKEYLRKAIFRPSLRLLSYL